MSKVDFSAIRQHQQRLFSQRNHKMLRDLGSVITQQVIGVGVDQMAL
jgi:hypothetical protein